MLIPVGNGIFEKLERGEEGSEKAGEEKGEKERRRARDWGGVGKWSLQARLEPSTINSFIYINQTRGFVSTIQCKLFTH